MPALFRASAVLALILLAAACSSAPAPAGDAVMPVGPDALEGDT